MSRMDLSRRSARWVGGWVDGSRDSLYFLSPRWCCRANNYGPASQVPLSSRRRLPFVKLHTHTLIIVLLTGLIQLLSRGGASASRPPSLSISHSLSGGSTGPKAEDRSLLCICQGDRTLRRRPSGTMAPSSSHNTA